MKPTLAILAAALLLGGCAGKTATAVSSSASSLPLVAPSIRWSPAPAGAHLVALVTAVRKGFWEAYRRGRAGESLESNPDILLPPKFAKAGPSRRHRRSPVLCSATSTRIPQR
jgi:hypothetical protein